MTCKSVDYVPLAYSPELQLRGVLMFTTVKSQLGRLVRDEGGFLEGDWVMIAGILGVALSLSSYFGYNIGHIVGQAFDDLILSALRRAGA